MRGIRLLREQAWAPALAEFLLSRGLYPTRVATNNAGIALQRLERYDEALDMFETLLRDFKVPPAQRANAQRLIAELRQRVGTIDITGSEPGASIVISSVDRGQYPPVKPLRVAAGNHVVRVYKEGFEPFETRIDVAGGQLARVEAKLHKLTDSGRIRVFERTGRTLDVVIDNVTVGKTPWVGRAAVGKHTVRLRGTGKLGTPPASAEVRSQELTQLALVAEDLEASLRVDPVPPGASVWIDGVNVGNGVWLGRLKAGSHSVEVKADGFLTTKRPVELLKGQRERVAVELDRDEDAPRWRKPSKWTVDVSASVALAPTFGGPLADSCAADCANPVGIGPMVTVAGSYELGSGLGFGVQAGYLLVLKRLESRNTTIRPNGYANSSAGQADDSLRLNSFLAGAHLSYHFGQSWPVWLGLGAGVLHGQLRDERSGHFAGQQGSDYDAFGVVAFPSATFFYVAPVLRAGLRLAEHLELSAEVETLLLVALSQPHWDDSLEVAAAGDGIARYDDETLTGPFMALVAPGANLRYEF